ncbi:hypothetical protein DESC_790054 [Desulfosarcina cetonica]|nr:hypothetical protein DESC_790054 [Desulfosarcina cetonica]
MDIVKYLTVALKRLLLCLTEQHYFLLDMIAINLGKKSKWWMKTNSFGRRPCGFPAA